MPVVEMHPKKSYYKKKDNDKTEKIEVDDSKKNESIGSTNTDVESKYLKDLGMDSKRKNKKRKQWIILALAIVLLLIGILVVKSLNKGPVAAYIGNTDIYESTITSQIELMRSNYNLTDDSAWKDFLNEKNTSAESIRKYLIEAIADESAIEQTITNRDIKADQQKVEEMHNSDIQQYGSQEALTSTLNSYGLTEQDYQKQNESIIQQKELGRQLCYDDDSKYVVQLLASDSYKDKVNNSTGFYMLAVDSSEEAQQLLSQLEQGSINMYDKAIELKNRDNDNGLNSELEFFTFMYDDQDVPNFVNSIPMGGYQIKQHDNYYVIYHPVEIVHSTSPFTSFDGVDSQLKQRIIDTVANNLQGEIIHVALNDLKDALGYEIYPMPSDVSYNVS